MEITAFDLAQRFVGTEEVAGSLNNPQLMAMLKLDTNWPPDDETPWCSAFVNYICHLLRLPRSKSLMARSWLGIGRAIDLDEAEVGFDIVVFQRGADPQPDASVTDAPGHVAFFAGFAGPTYVEVLGGNQGDQVKISRYREDRILSVRRLLG